MRVQGLVGYLLIGAMGVLVAVPLGFLLYTSFFTTIPISPRAQFSFGNYQQVFRSETFALLQNTLILAVGTTIVSLIIGASLAYIVARTNVFGRSFYEVLIMAPFLLPRFIGATAWIGILSPKGVLNGFLTAVGLPAISFPVYSMGTMIFIQGVYDAALVFMVLVGPMRTMDRSLEEASNVSGAGIITTLRRITFPIMRPAMLSAALLIIILSIGAFDVPLFIGMPGKTFVFTSALFSALKMQQPTNYGLATAYSIVLLCITGVGIFFYRRATRRAEAFATLVGKTGKVGVHQLRKRYRYGISAIIAIYFIFTIGLPFFTIGLGSFVKYFGVINFTDISGRLTLENWTDLFQHSLVPTALRNSILLMIVGATITMLLSSVIAYMTLKLKVRGGFILENLAMAPIAIPPVTFAFGIMLTYLIVPVGIYGTIWIMLLAYITLLLPFGYRTMAGAVVQVHQELEEASKVCGAGTFRTFFRIVMPLVSESFWSGWVLLAIVMIRELSSSLLLFSRGNETIAVVLYDLWHFETFSHVFFSFATLVCIISIIIVLVFRKLRGARIG